MILIICVDDQFGMMFNDRRQSSDRAVIKRIIEMSNGNRLWMDPYSTVLFPESTQICCDINFLRRASRGDYCFVETVDIENNLDCAEKIILFRWNRRYPADLYFPVTALDNGWRRVEISEFTGTSHERITMEVYER